MAWPPSMASRVLDTLSRIPQDKGSLPSTNGRRRLHADRNGRAANSAMTCLMVARRILLATGVGSRSANDFMARKRPKNQWSRKIVHGHSVTVTIDSGLVGVRSGTRVLDLSVQLWGSSDSFAVYLRIDIRMGGAFEHEGQCVVIGGRDLRRRNNRRIGNGSPNFRRR